MWVVTVAVGARTHRSPLWEQVLLPNSLFHPSQLSSVRVRLRHLSLCCCRLSKSSHLFLWMQFSTIRHLALHRFPSCVCFIMKSLMAFKSFRNKSELGRVVAQSERCRMHPHSRLLVWVPPKITKHTFPSALLNSYQD